MNNSRNFIYAISMLMVGLAVLMPAFPQTFFAVPTFIGTTWGAALCATLLITGCSMMAGLPALRWPMSESSKMLLSAFGAQIVGASVPLGGAAIYAGVVTPYTALSWAVGTSAILSVTAGLAALILWLAPRRLTLSAAHA